MKNTQKRIQFIFFLHMNDCAAEVSLTPSITSRLTHSTESQKAEQEYKRRDGIYSTRSTIAPGTFLPQEKIGILKRHLSWDSANMGGCSHTTQHHMWLQKFSLLSFHANALSYKFMQASARTRHPPLFPQLLKSIIASILYHVQIFLAFEMILFKARA